MHGRQLPIAGGISREDGTRELHASMTRTELLRPAWIIGRGQRHSPRGCASA